MASGPLARGRPDSDTTRWRNRMAQLFKQVVTDDDVIEVIEHVTEMAKNSGDIQWASLFLAYTMGKPASMDPALQGIQVDGDLTLTINQLSTEQLREAAHALKTLDATFTTVTPEPLSAPAHQ